MIRISAIQTIVCSLLLTSVLRAQLVYDANAGLDPFPQSTPDFNVGSIVADKVTLGGTERQLASIDVSMLVAFGDTADIHINLYRDDAGGGPGTLFAQSSPKSYSFIASSVATVTFSEADFTFFSMPEDLDNEFYVGIELDAYTPGFPSSFTGVALVDDDLVSPGSNTSTEDYFQTPGGGAPFTEATALATANALGLTINAVHVIPEPAVFSLLLIGSAAAFRLYRTRR